jgi:hypothetical protein
VTEHLDTPIDYTTLEFAATYDELPFWLARAARSSRTALTAIDATSRFYGVDVWRTALFTEVRLVEKSFTMCFQNGSAF